MNEQALNKKLQGQFSKPGWVLLVYYGIMNALTGVVVFADFLLRVIVSEFRQEILTDVEFEQMFTSALGNAWGYIWAIAVGFLILFLWKKREFCLKVIWKKEKSMTPGAFFALFALFFSAQAVAQVISLGLDALLGLLGLRLDDAMDLLSGDTVSMFLYASLLAPVSEEILFRGLLIHMLRPYGKKFSILATAFLFAMFHGNLIQTPYAFVVGLVLGYVAVEYSLGWSVLLHILNNMVLADFMTRLSEILPPGVGDLITMLFIWGCVVAAICILLVRRKAVKAYITEKKIHPMCIRNFFAAPGIIVFTVLMAGTLLYSTLIMLIPV